MSKILVSFREILDKGHWDQFCEDKRYNPWMLNEGLAEGDGEIELSIEEAKKYGVLRNEE